jgi:hypothetical protein
MNAIWLLCGAILVGIGYNVGAVMVRYVVVNYYEYKQRKNASAINKLIQVSQLPLQFPGDEPSGPPEPKGNN